MDPNGVDLLLELLELSEGQDPDGEVRVMAVFNLGLLGDERASQPLIDLLDDQDLTPAAMLEELSQLPELHPDRVQGTHLKGSTFDLPRL